jgi:hypothetical protein
VTGRYSSLKSRKPLYEAHFTQVKATHEETIYFTEQQPEHGCLNPDIPHLQIQLSEIKMVLEITGS